MTIIVKNKTYSYQKKKEEEKKKKQVTSIFFIGLIINYSKYFVVYFTTW